MTPSLVSLLHLPSLGRLLLKLLAQTLVFLYFILLFKFCLFLLVFLVFAFVGETVG